MAKVKHNEIITEHETALEVAARLAACCTFTYADARKQAGYALPALAVWLVFNFDENTWRVALPGTWLEESDDANPYEIDPRKSEGEAAREILRILELGDL